MSERGICVTSGYPIGLDGGATLQAEAIVYGSFGRVAARFVVNQGPMARDEEVLRRRVVRRAEAWLAADDVKRARMQGYERRKYSTRTKFWTKLGL